MFLYLLLLAVIIFLLVILSWIWPPDSPWSLRWRTNKKTARAAFKLVKIGKNDIIYELGSGEARVLMVAVSEFNAKGVGIEIDPIRFFLSRFAIWHKGLSSEIKMTRGNFFNEDLSEATAIFVYLVPKTLNRLIPKFKRELKKGTPIISYRYEINLPLKKFDRKNELRLYEI